MNSVDIDNRCTEERMARYTGGLPNKSNGLFVEYYINASIGLNISVIGSEADSAIHIHGTNNKILGKLDSVIISVRNYPKGRTYNTYGDNITVEPLRTFEIPITCLEEGPIYCEAIDKVICLIGDEKLALHPKNALIKQSNHIETNSIFNNTGKLNLTFNVVGNDPSGRISEAFIVINNEICRISFTHYKHLDAEPEIMFSYNSKTTVKGFKDTERRYKLHELYKIEDHGIISIENTFMSFSYKTLIDFWRNRQHEMDAVDNISKLSIKRLDIASKVNKLQSDIIKSTDVTDELIDKKTNLILGIKEKNLLIKYNNENKNKDLGDILSDTATMTKAVASIFATGVAVYKLLKPFMK